MKTKSNGIYMLLYAGCVFWGGITMQHPCFSQEIQIISRHKLLDELDIGFKQLTNQELVSTFLNESSIFRKYNPDPETPARYDMGLFSRRCLPASNDFFRTLISSRDRKHQAPLAEEEGDKSILQKLEWVIETNKNTYGLGEPIGFRLSLRNISEDEVTVYCTSRIPLPAGFVLLSMRLDKCSANNNTVYLTQSGFSDCLSFPGMVGFEYGHGVPSQAVLVQSGNKARINQGIAYLNHYYDLSQPGEYELTFYTRDFLADDEHQIGKYPKPCTIRFKIEGNTNWLDNQVVWPEDGE